MKPRSIATALLALAALTLAGCKPAVRGRCNTTADCRQGAYCAVAGICLASSGTCAPVCGAGEICSGSVCAALKPVVSVKVPSGPISPAFPQITVRVDAAVGIALHGLAVEVDSSDRALASGALDAPQTGDNLLTLSKFTANTAGSVSVRATLRYLLPGAAAEESISSVAVPAFYDSASPTVAVSVPAAADAVNGWVPRTSGTLEVRATVDDGAGSGAQSATLSFDTCPATADCSYPGAVVLRSGGATVFSFAVSRFAQAPGSEATLAVTVKAQDVAGNKAQGAGIVKIDDAPPQIGALGLVSTGAVGEDGNTWFLGGQGAPAVEIVVPVSDAGAGVASLALLLDANDLYSGFSASSLNVTGTPMADGIHFQLPASGVRGKEQHLRFTLTAADLLYRFSPLQHVATLGPDDPSTMIWVDALPPVIAFGPRVDYTTASGTAPQCGTDGPTYQCGRQGQTHLLADDTATVTFDAYDCGAGMAQAQPAATVATKATSQTAAVSEKGRGGSPCSNGSTNKTHHYNFTLNLATLALSYDAPGTSGTTPVQLVANLQDRLLQGASSSPGAPTSADGAALVSLWRWKSQFAPNAQPSGSPALLPGSAGSRQIAIGTTLPPSSPNFFVLNADGTQPWNATVQIGIAGDVAAGSGGALYTVTPPAGSCGSGCNAALNILTAPSGSGTTGAVQACAASNVSFGAPPVIITATATIPERAVVASTSHAVGATANVFLFQSGCTSTETDLVGTGDFPGISANWPTLFLATGQGFSSADHSDAAGRFGTPAAYNSGNTVPTVSPPAIASGAPVNAIFAGSADDFVHRTASSTCTTLSCWTDVSGFAPAVAQSSLPFTPVFDATAIYAADAQGKVYAVDKVSGAASWSFDFRNGALPSPWPSGSGTTVSPPILLQGGTALVVRSDGVVALASAAGPVPLLQMTKALTGAPAAPVIDIRGTGGVAYVHDGAGWIYALQLQSPPATPGSAVWPRPGRDSCNSRNAASSCQ